MISLITAIIASALDPVSLALSLAAVCLTRTWRGTAVAGAAAGLCLGVLTAALRASELNLPVEAQLPRQIVFHLLGCLMTALIFRGLWKSFRAVKL